MSIDFPKIEKKILKFWKKNKIFEKTLKKTEKGQRFVFYEGPPFANGLPGIHHLLARAFKDIIVRYKTMRGFFVERRAGWDTHGLPTEIEAEKKLNIKNKKEIEKIGIEKFIKECQRNVFTYKKEWEEFTDRIGFWLDLKNAYITCSNDYIESLWWILKQIWQKKLLYQDYKVVPYCPRCATSLSSHEVAQGYKKITEPAIFLKLKIKNSETYNLNPNTYLLIWTTTPWTLPGNVAVAVNPKFTYVKVKVGEEFVILAKERLNVLGKKYKIVDEFKGKSLVGLEYQPLFDFTRLPKKAHFVVAGDFVSTDEGTGLVHMAPAFGEDDIRTARKNNLPIIVNVDEEGKFTKEVKLWAGESVTDEKLNKEIIKIIAGKKLLFAEELYEHDYPFCWRCDSKLIYYAKDSWFIKMATLKKDLIENNRKINWIPRHIKQGRFGEWLREIKDWNLSRERYWGTPLPIWKCQTEKCQNIKVIGSIKELEKLSGRKIKDLHRPDIDGVSFRCEKCGGLMKRVPEVIDCWFDSGSMPFAQWHYPFGNKDRIDKGISFPADFIAEGIDQTRGWFYTLLAISTLLGQGPPYKNVICLGLVLDSKRQKMSKSRGNVVWPNDVIDKYGADAARWYFYTVNQPGDPKLFSEGDVEQELKKFILTLWNCYTFLETYFPKKEFSIFFCRKRDSKPKKILDKWIISKLNNLIQEATQRLDNYDVTGAARAIESFVVEDLSLWYIRRSRRRFQKPKSKKELKDASTILGFVLLTLSKITAPFVPFLSEEIFQKIHNSKTKFPLPKVEKVKKMTSSFSPFNIHNSIHLEDWPKANKRLIDKKLEDKMIKVREVVTLVLAERAKTGIKVRQPLNELRITNYELRREKELLELIKDEVNVKEITFGKTLKLDTKITEELKEEGQVREFIRQVQQLRKNAELTPKDKIIIYCECQEKLKKVLEKNKKDILAETRAKELRIGRLEEKKLKPREIKIDNEKLNLVIKKVVKL